MKPLITKMLRFTPDEWALVAQHIAALGLPVAESVYMKRLILKAVGRKSAGRGAAVGVRARAVTA